MIKSAQNNKKIQYKNFVHTLLQYDQEWRHIWDYLHAAVAIRIIIE